MSSPQTPTSGDSHRRIIIVVVAALASAVLLLFVGIFAYQGGVSQQNAQAGQETQSSSGSSETGLDVARRIADDPTALGDVDAPVVMIEYADYRCPFCGLFARDTLPPLVDKYVESGDLRIEWRDLPVFGDESFAAAVAGRAAGEQGLFWEFNKAVFDIAPERGHAELPRERLLEIAAEIGVPDMAKFEADLDSEKLEQAVTTDAQEAATLGATGTPTFLVNDTPFVGAQPLATFEEAIDAALEQAESS
ncbi:DsbA family protein [Arthrobacter sp. TB 23]|uniref:DsbA family protein n=1 Tax=Arthrobacter sp. TB 23 TaxID=494419 RepID=UPI00030C15BD|nr:DsbA family protein [Arthrobacter sp. TB 23]